MRTFLNNQLLCIQNIPRITECQQNIQTILSFIVFIVHDYIILFYKLSIIIVYSAFIRIKQKGIFFQRCLLTV